MIAGRHFVLPKRPRDGAGSEADDFHLAADQAADETADMDARRAVLPQEVKAVGVLPCVGFSRRQIAEALFAPSKTKLWFWSSHQLFGNSL